jgi:hypothetical protein
VVGKGEGTRAILLARQGFNLGGWQEQILFGGFAAALAAGISLSIWIKILIDKQFGVQLRHLIPLVKLAFSCTPHPDSGWYSVLETCIAAFPHLSINRYKKATDFPWLKTALAGSQTGGRWQRAE